MNPLHQRLSRHWWANCGQRRRRRRRRRGGARSFRWRAKPARPPAAPPAVPVSVATVQESDVTAWDEFSGRLEAVERVDVRSRVAGAVQAVHFREGALVAKGDLLITIDPAPYAAEVERAEAQVGAAQARLTHADNEHTARLRLWEDSAIAQRELDERANACAAKPRPTCAPRRRNCRPRA
jgi:multidrug efflux system membrane fusion protein